MQVVFPFLIVPYGYTPFYTSSVVGTAFFPCQGHVRHGGHSGHDIQWFIPPVFPPISFPFWPLHQGSCSNSWVVLAQYWASIQDTPTSGKVYASARPSLHQHTWAEAYGRCCKERWEERGKKMVHFFTPTRLSCLECSYMEQFWVWGYAARAGQGQGSSTRFMLS